MDGNNLILRFQGEKNVLHNFEAAELVNQVFKKPVRPQSFKLCRFLEYLVWYRKMGWPQVFVIIVDNRLFKVPFPVYTEFSPQEVKKNQKAEFCFKANPAQRDFFKAKVMMAGDIFQVLEAGTEGFMLTSFHEERNPKNWEELTDVVQNAYEAMAKGVYPLTGE